MAAQHPQAQAPAAEWPRAEASYPYPHRNDPRQTQIAEHYARRPDRIGERAAAQQAKTAGREAVYQAKIAAREQRKTAFRDARGPWRWPEWSLITGAAGFVAWLALVGVAHGNLDSGPGIAAVPVFLIWIFAALIAAPAVLWRRYRARHAAAANARQRGAIADASPRTRPGPQT